jgi:HEAT repeat protein
VELLQSSNAENQVIAREGLVQLGHTTIPYLIDVIEITTDPMLQQNVVQVWSEIGQKHVAALVLALKNAKTQSRKLLIRAITKVGESSISPIIEMLRLTTNQEVREDLEEALKQMGPGVIPKLLSLSYDPVADVRKVAREIIKEFGKKGVPTLIQILQGEDKEQKKYALVALADIGTDAAEAITIVKPLLTIPGDMQYSAVYAIQKMGSVAKEVVPELLQAFDKSSDWMVRAAAAYALANAEKYAIRALPTLQKNLKTEKYGEVRVAICKAIGSMGSEAKEAVPQLILGLEDLDESVVQAAAEALGNIGPSARIAIPNLIQVLSSYGANEREAAAKALAKIGTSSIPKLKYMLQFSEDTGARQGAAMALRYMGVHAAPAISTLILALKMDIPVVKKEAALALGEIGPVSASSMSALIEASRDESEIVRKAVSDALPKMGTHVVPLILLALERYEDNEEARVTLIRALGNMGGAANSAIGRLTEYLPKWQGAGQKEIIRTLGKMGERAKETTPMLIAILKLSDDQELHALIRDTLVELGKDSIHSIISLLKEEKALPRKTGIEILEKMGTIAIPYLLEILQKSEDEGLLVQAIAVVGKNKQYLDALLKLLKHPSSTVRNALIAVLVQVGGPAIPKLLQMVTPDATPEESKTICKALATIGESAVPHLIHELKKTDNPLVRKIIVDAIGEIGVHAQIAIVPLIDFMVKWTGEDRWMVARCFGKIGPATVSPLVKLLQHEEKEVREAAIIALGETQSPPVIPHLLATLKEPSLLHRVIHAIVKMKTLAAPVLANSIQDKDAYVRFATAAALMEIGEAANLEILQKQYSLEPDPMVKYMLQLAIRVSQSKK